MRNTILILTLALFISGCGQNAARVAKVEAEKKKLESEIAALKASKAIQSANQFPNHDIHLSTDRDSIRSISAPGPEPRNAHPIRRLR